MPNADLMLACYTGMLARHTGNYGLAGNHARQQYTSLVLALLLLTHQDTPR